MEVTWKIRQFETEPNISPPSWYQIPVQRSHELLSGSI